MPERPGWRPLAERLGFPWHTGKTGVPYWREDAAYVFEQGVVETHIERATSELCNMCLAAVGAISRSEQLMARMGLPKVMWQPIAESWQHGDIDIYGRFDLCWDGVSPARMYEFNAATAATLFESSVFQWIWYEAMRAANVLGPDTDQFNRLHDALVARFRRAADARPLHVSCLGNMAEDVGTARYLMDCALQAGMDARWCPITEVSLDAAGLPRDNHGQPITRWLPFYYHEWLVRDGLDLARLRRANIGIIEPVWRCLMGNKGLLAVLWSMFPGHPNLLPSFFEDDTAGLATLGGCWAKKPLFGFEGGNVTLAGGCEPESSAGPFGEEGYVYQALCPLPRFGDSHALVGSWVVGREACGIGMREQDRLITTPSSRFVPHYLR